MQTKCKMAKEKKGKSASLPQRHIHLRIAFLHQAASRLSKPAQKPIPESSAEIDKIASPPRSRQQTVPTQSRYLINHMKGVSRKSVIRLSKDVKRSVCKRCDSLLEKGSTSAEQVENKSKNGSKPWADILIVKCMTCGVSKRFPTSASRAPEKQPPSVA